MAFLHAVMTSGVNFLLKHSPPVCFRIRRLCNVSVSMVALKSVLFFLTTLAALLRTQLISQNYTVCNGHNVGF